MRFNTRKGGHPEPIGAPIYLSPAEIAAAAAGASKQLWRGHSPPTQCVLAELKAALPDAEFSRLSRPDVRYQALEPGRPLAGPRGWHLDFARQPRTLYLFVSHGPPTLFLRASNLEGPDDPDQHQPRFDAHVEQQVEHGLGTWEAPVGRIMRYDSYEAHRSQTPTRSGWRYFFRAWADI